MMMFRKMKVAILAAITLLAAAQFTQGASLSSLERDYSKQTQPILQQYCLGCHSTEKHKGDLDLERFTSFSEVMKHPKVWQGVVEQLGLGEMPPKDKPQPTAAEKERLQQWVNDALDAAAQARAGDPARSC